MILWRKELIALYQLLVYWFSAPNSPFSVCSMMTGRSLQIFLLHSKDNVKFVPVEGAGGILQGEGGFSSLWAVFCFFLLLLQRPSVTHVCGDIRDAQTMQSLGDLTASAWAQ